MPIYEFYCQKCNTIYNFFSKSVNTEKIPGCPKCKVKLKREMSVFANISKSKENDTDGDMPPIDEAKMEKAMAMLASEAGNINEDDPKQAAMLMRKLKEKPYERNISRMSMKPFTIYNRSLYPTPY
jgi:putative FmdB family regulatory protein